MFDNYSELVMIACAIPVVLLGGATLVTLLYCVVKERFAK